MSKPQRATWYREQIAECQLLYDQRRSLEGF